MSFQIRRIIAESVSEFLKPDINSHYQLLTAIPHMLELRKSENNYQPELHLPTKNNLFKTLNIKDIEKISTEMKYDQSKILNISIINEIKKSNMPTIIFKLNPKTFANESYLNETTKLNLMKNDNIVVEFSSPNIAKPFHVGHLRSTIIGNFIGNLYKFLGNNVTKLNYLGDWGTQFGLLEIGLEITNVSDEEIQKNPIKHLLNAYVVANEAAKNNPEIAEKARRLFTKLEENEDSNLEIWQKCRSYTLTELDQVYNRLGIHFDQFDWESQYKQKDIQNVLRLLESKNLLLDELDGRKVAQVGERRVPLIKSDGSTLYLVRDIAALLDRYKRYNFDKMFYVVDKSQTDHFNACFTISNQLNHIFHNRTEHIKFGRIQGMSTRQGNIIFLNDILDEARSIMLEKQIQSPTTKININQLENQIADVLGITAVIVNDLKQRRQRDYEFSWEKALQVNGDTGIKLQYTHCRLCSLIKENSNISMAEEPDLSYLSEKEAMDLLIEIGRFPEILLRSKESLEPCILVNYLFSLSNITSRTIKALNVKYEKSDKLQSQRLKLFESSRVVLNKGMKILGLKPLSKM